MGLKNHDGRLKIFTHTNDPEKLNGRLMDPSLVNLAIAAKITDEDGRLKGLSSFEQLAAEVKGKGTILIKKAPQPDGTTLVAVEGNDREILERLFKGIFRLDPKAEFQHRAPSGCIENDRGHLVYVEERARLLIDRNNDLRGKKPGQIMLIGNNPTNVVGHLFSAPSFVPATIEVADKPAAVCHLIGMTLKGVPGEDGQEGTCKGPLEVGIQQIWFRGAEAGFVNEEPVGMYTDDLDDLVTRTGINAKFLKAVANRMFKIACNLAADVEQQEEEQRVINQALANLG